MEEVNIREEIENSLLLYLPTGMSLDDKGRLEYEFERASAANYQVSLLLSDVIDSEYFLDQIESQGIDMDEYVSIACGNLEQFL